MRSKAMNQKNLMMRIITTPYRALCKAKDFYIRSITDCANHNTYGRAGGIAGSGTQLPRSFSTSSFGSNDSAADDLRELIRANSAARNGDLNNMTRAELELYIQQQVMMKQLEASRKVPRSVSVGMGRIDEDAPVSSFGDDKDMFVSNNRKAKSDHLMFPRSKSHAVTSTTKIGAFS